MDVGLIVSWVQLALWAVALLQRLPFARIQIYRQKIFYIALVYSVGLSAFSLWQNYHWEAPFQHLSIEKEQLVEGKLFVNQNVEVDGKHFEGCHFINVRLVYNGKASAAFSHNTFSNSVVIGTQSERISAYTELIYQLELLGTPEMGVRVGKDNDMRAFIAKSYESIPKGQSVPLGPQ